MGWSSAAIKSIISSDNPVILRILTVELWRTFPESVGFYLFKDSAGYNKVTMTFEVFSGVSIPSAIVACVGFREQVVLNPYEIYGYSFRLFV